MADRHKRKGHGDTRDLTDDERDRFLAAVDENYKAEVVEDALRARWGADEADRMTTLCKMFPTLVDAPGTTPWDPSALLNWVLTSRTGTATALHAVKFVLQVWNTEADWERHARAPVSDSGLGLENAEFEPFKVVAALYSWDEHHKAAFLAWVQLPFWPSRDVPVPRDIFA